MAARKGLNAKFTYPDQSGRAQSYSLRVSGVRHGIHPIFTESAARIRRVFYPHLSALDKFSVDIEMISQDEYISLNGWLTHYVDFALNQDRPGNFPFMVVNVPSRKFARIGIPVQGFEWGDKAARMSWGITVVFETAGDLYNPGNGARPIDSTRQLSRVPGNQKALNDPNVKYFYPFDRLLSGSQKPDDGTYAVPITLDDIVTGDVSGSQDGSNIGVNAGTGS